MHEPRFMKPLVPSGGLSFETANGVINADTICDLVVPTFAYDDAYVTPYVLPDSPDVLSIGRRCVQDGYGFYWAPFSHIILPLSFHPIPIFLGTVSSVPQNNGSGWKRKTTSRI